MKKEILTLLLIFIICGLLTACRDTTETKQSANDEGVENEERVTMNRIKLETGGKALEATLMDNSSAEAFVKLLESGPLTIDMSEYGGFEVVGPIEGNIPENNEQITTKPGDIILYQGNQITVYYGVNSWNFTKLGEISGATEDSMKEFLGDGDISITFSLVK